MHQYQYMSAKQTRMHIHTHKTKKTRVLSHPVQLPSIVFSMTATSLSHVPYALQQEIDLEAVEQLS